jgi:thiosulfate/3-mercaptopyruvate sulfurtransferase
MVASSRARQHAWARPRAIMDNSKGYANPQLLITAGELHALTPAILDATNPKRPLLLDVRPAEQFAAGHIPGAIHFDLFGLSLNDTDPAPLKSFLSMIEHLFAARGVSADRPVIVYDDRSGERSARAFWFLEFFDHPNVRVLDGGAGAWTRAGYALTAIAEPPVATEWHGARRNEILATYQDVLDRINTSASATTPSAAKVPDAVILDARTDGEYCGTTVRSARGGAVPGAVHLEWLRNLDADGAFKPAAELKAMYEAAGITPDREVVSYCQGGYRAANSYLALRLLGYPRLRNYLGSWREWGNRPELPVEIPASA